MAMIGVESGIHPYITYASFLLNAFLIPVGYKVISIEKKIIQLSTIIKNNCPECSTEMKKDL